MRTPFLIVASVIAAGCADARITVAGHHDSVRFEFVRSGKPILVGAIEIFEFGSGGRGPTICELRLSRSAADLAAMTTWTYGRGVAGYTTIGCPGLSPGPRYGVNVFHSRHCTLHIKFNFEADGSVRALEPGWDSCIM